MKISLFFGCLITMTKFFFFSGGLVLLALGLLTSTFRFIPKATLAGLIICAMYYMLDFSTYSLLWHARSKFHRFLFLPIFFSLSLSCSDSLIRDLTSVASMAHAAQKELASARAPPTLAFAVHLFSKSPRETIMLERAFGGIYC